MSPRKKGRGNTFSGRLTPPKRKVFPRPLGGEGGGHAPPGEGVTSRVSNFDLRFSNADFRISVADCRLSIFEFRMPILDLRLVSWW